MAGSEQTRWVVAEARRLGFDLCGIAPIEEFEELARLPEWLARGYSGEMGYLADARRREPARVLPEARSLIVCALNYNTPLPYSTEVPAGVHPRSDVVSAVLAHSERSRDATPAPSTPSEASQAISSPASRDPRDPYGPRGWRGPRGWISRYAWGDDYHAVMLDKLKALVAALRAQVSEPFEARVYVDTGPVLERVAAKYAGLGWLAKNTCLINRQLGSWLFLGVILTTLELAPSLESSDIPSRPSAEPPLPDLCGNCRLCIEACPTGAIVEPYLLDARRCISYLTIELRGSIPIEFRQAMGRHVFGCDICQDVCPWNRDAPVTQLAEFLPRTFATQQPVGTRHAVGRQDIFHALPLPSAGEAPELDPVSLFAPELEWLAGLTEDEYKEVFRASPTKRTKWRGLVRNACVALGNSGVSAGTAAHSRIVGLLERLADSDDAIIAEHARWALGRLCGTTN